MVEVVKELIPIISHDYIKWIFGAVVEGDKIKFTKSFTAALKKRGEGLTFKKGYLYLRKGDIFIVMYHRGKKWYIEMYHRGKKWYIEFGNNIFEDPEIYED
ncbi:MAG: hypothetical protein ACFFC1_20445 [Promethearchaeota archaeon]